MNTLKNENRDFTSDIDYHFNEIETDLNRAKLDHNRNFILLRLFEKILNTINLIKLLILSEPKVHFNILSLEMKRQYSELPGELDGFNIQISFKEDPKSSRMGLIKMGMDKKMMEDG